MSTSEAIAPWRGFLTRAVLRLNDEDTGFVIERDLVWVGARQVFTIRAGSTTDLGSRPRVTSYLFEKFGEGTTEPFILHDFLRRSKAVSDRDADNIFLLAMLENGVSPLRAELMWAAVRLDTRLSDATAEERARVRRIAPTAALLLLPVPIVWSWQHLFEALERA